MTLAEATTIFRNSTSRKLPSSNRSNQSSNKGKQTLSIYEYDPIADRNKLEQLATQCHQFSPLVGIETEKEPSSLLLDITGSAPRLGGELQLAQQLADLITNFGYYPRIAVSDTLGAAWAFARQSQKIRIVPTGEQRQELASLPIQSLRLSSSIGEILSQLGIRTNGELFHLPRESLRARFGPNCCFAWTKRLGVLPKPSLPTPAPHP